MYNLRYKLRIITPLFPTFKPAHTYLDICLADSRLKTNNLINEKAPTLPYGSDHAAISIEFEFDNDNILYFNQNNEKQRFNYKATKWNKFYREVDKLYNSTIQDNCNFTIAEINKKLLYINNVISYAIHNIVPVIKPNDNINRYINNRITKLQKVKKFLVSLLHKLHITDLTSRLPLTRSAKANLKVIRDSLHWEFKMASEKFWKNQIKKIDYRNSEVFFPNINRLFRPKGLIKIEDIHIHLANQELLVEANVI